MLTFIRYEKCTTCQKARAFLDRSGAEYEIRDIKANNPNYEELKSGKVVWQGRLWKTRRSIAVM